MSTVEPATSLAATTSETPLEDQIWMDSDLSGLERFESYDWGEIDPLTLGQPVEYIPGTGIVVVSEP